MSVVSGVRTNSAASAASARVRLAADVMTKIAAEGVVILVAAGTAILLLRATAAHGMHPLQYRADPLLAAATAGLAAVVALLCAVSSRLRAEPGLRVVTYAWGYYALVVMPVSVILEAPGTSPIVPGGAAAGISVFIALLALGLVEPQRQCSADRPIVNRAIAAVALVTFVGLSAGVAANFDSGFTQESLLVVWGVLACAYIARGFRRREPVWHRMGYGIALIAAAHLVLQTGVTIEFAVLRFVGFLVLVGALSLHAREVVTERRAARAEAVMVAAAKERAASEHRHEMRNVLATLACVTTMMTPRPDAAALANDGSINAMIDDELARLRNLLEGMAPSRDKSTARVDAVLSRLVTLRRYSGAPITLDGPSGLEVAVPEAVLTQVVTNLLENCARHAPGAAIYVAAYSEPGGCVVEVTDAGPGINPTAPTSGDGLGLSLSTRIIEAAGGTLQLGAGTRFTTGTTALLHVPLAAAPPQEPAAVASGGGRSL
ncbi:sensor histidine kinase [Spelaeicoccus albus]|uniref:histidine kinase n=1 Tax=Spelaeicoccus albus TaxID=1280376 RepID=A0A7Z0IJ86_9MICO|nr:HAMP domain-containing sensor histidine kinase [Spelaeicoccus albus]NYI69171.1 two-component system OmpR family sensor kinase [Spelaeicoccus albus]